jgi:hypothetical protein
MDHALTILYRGLDDLWVGDVSDNLFKREFCEAIEGGCRAAEDADLVALRNHPLA